MALPLGRFGQAFLLLPKLLPGPGLFVWKAMDYSLTHIREVGKFPILVGDFLFKIVKKELKRHYVLVLWKGVLIDRASGFWFGMAGRMKPVSQSLVPTVSGSLTLLLIFVQFGGGGYLTELTSAGLPWDEFVLKPGF